jgi:hypothetical protein
MKYFIYNMYNSIPRYEEDITNNNIKLSESHSNNPYSLDNWPIDNVNYVKASLKWEAGNWSRQELLILRKKVMYCYIRKEAHWELTLIYSRYAKYLDIPKVILSSILSTSLFVNASEDDGFSTTMHYTNAIMGTVVAILVGLESYIKFGDLYTQHRNSSLEYGKLGAEIERLLHTDIDERESFSNALAKIDEKYAKIRDESPFISQDKIKKYIKSFNTTNESNDIVNVTCRTKINENQDEDTREYEKYKEEQKKLRKTQENLNTNVIVDASNSTSQLTVQSAVQSAEQSSVQSAEQSAVQSALQSAEGYAASANAYYNAIEDIHTKIEEKASLIEKYFVPPIIGPSNENIIIHNS